MSTYTRLKVTKINSYFLDTVEVQWIFDPIPLTLWLDSVWYYVELQDIAS